MRIRRPTLYFLLVDYYPENEYTVTHDNSSSHVRIRFFADPPSSICSDAHRFHQPDHGSTYLLLLPRLEWVRLVISVHSSLHA